MNNFRKSLINKVYILLLILLIFDLGYSFYEYYNTPLGGDIAEVVLPKPHVGYYEVLHDPFGIESMTKGVEYPNPNRFFAHYLTSSYLINVPLFFQNFVSPIDSVYLTAALAKWLIHFMFLYVFFLYVSNKHYKLFKEFILIALLTTPFFQTFSYCLVTLYFVNLLA